MKRTIIMALAVLLSATASFAQTTMDKKHKHKHHHHASSAMQYTCSMHPEVVSDKPGNCPKCGMAMVPMKKKAPKKDKAMGDMKM